MEAAGITTQIRPVGGRRRSDCVATLWPRGGLQQLLARVVPWDH
jgi:hypothetical protein